MGEGGNRRYIFSTTGLSVKTCVYEVIDEAVKSNLTALKNKTYIIS